MKEGSRCFDVKEDRNFMIFFDDVVVDVKGLRGYLCFFFEGFCSELWMLYLRLNLSMGM